MVRKDVLQWLLGPDQPSIKLLTLTQILGKTEKDQEVIAAKRSNTKQGWIADILERRSTSGFWAGEESLYKPKYLSTN
jgi:hypothetical protein